VIAAVIWLPCLHFLSPDAFWNSAKIKDSRPRRASSRPASTALDRPIVAGTGTEKNAGQQCRMGFHGTQLSGLVAGQHGPARPASKPLYLRTMDQSSTKPATRKTGRMYFFLMPYARDRHYWCKPAHRLFLDGEIALMLASRRVVEEKPEFKSLLTER